MPAPLAYFITFHTYGTWLHGEPAGSVDRNHNTPGQPFAPPSPPRRDATRRAMTGQPLHLTDPQRRLVCQTCLDVCAHRRWQPHALHVRTTHVHAVVTPPETHTPERVMTDLKAWCTRRLRESSLLAQDAPAWSEHGSTRWLWTPDKLAEKIHYVLHEQGNLTPDTYWPT